MEQPNPYLYNNLPSNPMKMLQWNDENSQASHCFIPSVAQHGYIEIEANSGSNDSGWKVHVAIDAKDLPQAWDLLIPALFGDNQEKQLSHFKVVPINSKKKFEKGKPLVIFFSKEELADQQFLQDKLKKIEQVLKKNNISPATKNVTGDKPVTGSTYCHYTCDQLQTRDEIPRLEGISDDLQARREFSFPQKKYIKGQLRANILDQEENNPFSQIDLSSSEKTTTPVSKAQQIKATEKSPGRG